eukprot:bmy_07368T0
MTEKIPRKKENIGVEVEVRGNEVEAGAKRNQVNIKMKVWDYDLCTEVSMAVLFFEMSHTRKYNHHFTFEVCGWVYRQAEMVRSYEKNKDCWELASMEIFGKNFLECFDNYNFRNIVEKVREDNFYFHKLPKKGTEKRTHVDSEVKNIFLKLLIAQSKLKPWTSLAAVSHFGYLSKGVYGSYYCGEGKTDYKMETESESSTSGDDSVFLLDSEVITQVNDTEEGEREEHFSFGFNLTLNPRKQSIACSDLTGISRLKPISLTENRCLSLSNITTWSDHKKTSQSFPIPMGSNSLATSVTEPYPAGQRTRNEQKTKIGRKMKSSVHSEEDDFVPELHRNVHPRERPDWEETLSAMLKFNSLLSRTVITARFSHVHQNSEYFSLFLTIKSQARGADIPEIPGDLSLKTCGSTASMKIKHVKKPTNPGLMGCDNIHRLPFTKGHFPKMAECAHFHYENVEFGSIQLSLSEEQNEVTKNGCESKELVYLVHIACQQNIMSKIPVLFLKNDLQKEQVFNHLLSLRNALGRRQCPLKEGGGIAFRLGNGELQSTVGLDKFILLVVDIPVFRIQHLSHGMGKSWIVKRSYEDFRVLDKHLHLCIYDRRFSQLSELPRSEALKDSLESVTQMLMAYLSRLSAIAGNKINCGPALTWMEIDNKGNHLLVHEESSINTPAVGAAHVVKRYTARAPDELTLEVGDIVSVIDMPPKVLSTWWRGKHGFQLLYLPGTVVGNVRSNDGYCRSSPNTYVHSVGLFPGHCVELINQKVPQSVTNSVPKPDSMYPWFLKEKNVCGVEGAEKRRGEKRGRKVDACPKEIGISFSPHRFWLNGSWNLNLDTALQCTKDAESGSY